MFYSLCHISLARRRAAACLSGQNQPIMVMATGMVPMVIPHGVKMLPMKAAVVVSAARNGQMVEQGTRPSYRARHRGCGWSEDGARVCIEAGYDWLIGRGVPKGFAAVDRGQMQEVIGRWRRGGGPLERAGVPGVRACDVAERSERNTL